MVDNTASFEFNTNLPIVGQEIVAELTRIEGAIQRTQAALGTTGSPQALAGVRQFAAEMDRTIQRAQQQIRAMGAEWQGAITPQGTRMEAPAGGTPLARTRQIAQDAGQEIARLTQTATDAYGSAIPPGEMAQLGRAGLASLQNGIQAVYIDTARNINEAAQQAGRRGPAAVPSRAVLSFDPVARQLDQLQARSVSQLGQAIERAKLERASITDPAQAEVLERQMRASSMALHQRLAQQLQANTTRAGQFISPQGAIRAGTFIRSAEGGIFQTAEGGTRAEPIPQRETLLRQRAEQAIASATQRTQRVKEEEAAWAERGKESTRERVAQERAAWESRQSPDQRRRELAALETQEVRQRRQMLDAEARATSQRQTAVQKRTADELRLGAERGQVQRAGAFFQRGSEIFEVQRGQAAQLQQGSDRYRIAQAQLTRSSIDLAREQQQSAVAERRVRGSRLLGVFGGGGRGGGGGGGMGGAFAGGPGELFQPEGIISHGARYARYALVAGALFGLQSAIRSTKDEAVDYADSLTDLEVAVGRQAQVTQAWKNELMDVSRIAGTNVAQAMDSAARGIRAFDEIGAEGARDAGNTIAHAAEQLAIIADTDVTGATGHLIAIGTSFEFAADGANRVNDAIAQAKRLGGYPEDIAEGLAGSAVAFREAGFNLEESAALVSLVVARLDQTGQTTGSRLARVFQTARGAPAQAALIEAGVEPGADVSEQLKQLAQLRAAGEIGEKQFERITAAVAGTFASREFTVLIRDMASAVDNVNEGLTEGGAATDEFNRRINNLAGLLRRIQGSLRGIQVGLIESGALAPIGALLQTLEPALRLLNEMLQLFNRLPNAVSTSLLMVGQFSLALRGLARLDASRMTGRGFETSLLGGGALGARSDEIRRRRAVALLERRGEPVPTRTPQVPPVPTAPAVTANTTAIARNTAARTRDVAASTRLTSSLAARIRGEQAMMVAVNNRTLAERRATLATTARTVRERASGVLRGTAGGIGAVARSPLGMGIGALIGVSAAFALFDSLQRSAEAADDLSEAFIGLAELGGEIENSLPDALRNLAREINTQAAEVESTEAGAFAALRRGFRGQGAREEAGSVEQVLNTLAYLIRAPIGAGEAAVGRDVAGGPNALRDADAARDFAEGLVERARIVDEALRESVDTSGAFGFAINSVEELEAGLERLGLRGATATEEVDAIIESLSGLGRGLDRGIIRPGLGEVFIEDVTGQSIEQTRGALQALANDKFRELFGVLQESLLDPRAIEDAFETFRSTRDEVGRLQGFRDLGIDEGTLRALGDLGPQASEQIFRAFEDLGPEVGSAVLRAMGEAGPRASRDILASFEDDESLRELYSSVQEALRTRLEELGIAEGGELAPADADQLASELAERFAGDWAGDLESLQSLVNLILRNSIDQATGLEGVRLEPQTMKAVRDAILSQLDQVEQLTQARTGDSVLAAQERLAQANEVAALEMANGTAASQQTQDAIRAAERNLQEATSERAALRRQFARALLDEGDVAGRTNLDLADANAALADAMSPQGWDVNEQWRQRARIKEIERRRVREERDRAAAEDLFQVPVGDELGEAEARLRAAQRVVDETTRLDSEGNVREDYAEAVRARDEAQLRKDEAVREVTAASLRSRVDSRDVVERARIDLQVAEAELSAQIPGTRAFYDALDRVNQQKLALARLEADRAAAARRAAIDPRDEVARAREDARAAQEQAALELPGTTEHSEAVDELNQSRLRAAETERERAAAQRRASTDPRDTLGLARADIDAARAAVQGELPGSRAYWDAVAQLKSAQQAYGRAQVSLSNAARTAAVDPRDTIGRAAAELANARSSLSAELPGTEAYYSNLGQIRQAQVSLAEAQRSVASAARRSQVFPGSQLEQARANIQDAEAELSGSLQGTVGYYQALGQLREAQLALGEALAAHQSNVRLLGLDITDPLVTAREEARLARRRLARLQAEGAPDDVIDEARLEHRRAEASAEQSAFQQRLQDAETARELGRTSHAAYISYLEEEAARLRAIQERTRQQQDQLDQVERTLKSARQAMEGQFNLGDIRVPTPFEVRRAIEARSRGLTPGQVTQSTVVNNDNSATVTVNGADLVEVKRLLGQLLGPQAVQRQMASSTRRV